MKCFYSNCFFVFVWLLFRGTARKAVVVTCPIWPYWHLVSLNRKGHALHFEHVLPDEQNPYKPYVYLGRIETIGAGEQRAVLKEKGRRVLYVEDRRLVIWAWCAAVTVWYAVPWAWNWGKWKLGKHHAEHNRGSPDQVLQSTPAPRR